MSERKPRGRRVKWTLERCIADAAQYSSRSEWNKKSGSAYQRARKHGWLDQCCAHMGGHFTLEICMAEAAKYATRMEWRSANRPSYEAAYRNGWLDQCCAHMTVLRAKKVSWTLQGCLADAARYERKFDWRENSPNAYAAAYRNGWLDQCLEHMSTERPSKAYWTLERCIEDAARFNLRIDWRNSASGAYNSACRNGWLDQCCEHMGRGYKATDNDVIYVWRDAGTDLHKIGVTSARIGEERVGICSGRQGMDPRIVFMLKVSDARAVESELLELGTDPELDSSIDGYTEFRVLSNDELRQAVSIAYEAALAA